MVAKWYQSNTIYVEHKIIATMIHWEILNLNNLINSDKNDYFFARCILVVTINLFPRVEPIDNSFPFVSIENLEESTLNLTVTAANFLFRIVSMLILLVWILYGSIIALLYLCVLSVSLWWVTTLCWQGEWNFKGIIYQLKSHSVFTKRTANATKSTWK